MVASRHVKGWDALPPQHETSQHLPLLRFAKHTHTYNRPRGVQYDISGFYLGVLLPGDVPRCHRTNVKHDRRIIWELHREMVRVVQGSRNRKACKDARDCLSRIHEIKRITQASEYARTGHVHVSTYDTRLTYVVFAGHVVWNADIANICQMRCGPKISNKAQHLSRSCSQGDPLTSHALQNDDHA